MVESSVLNQHIACINTRYYIILTCLNTRKQVFNFWYRNHDHCTRLIHIKWPLAGAAQQHATYCVTSVLFLKEAELLQSIVVLLLTPFLDPFVNITWHSSKVKRLISIIIHRSVNVYEQILCIISHGFTDLKVIALPELKILFFTLMLLQTCICYFCFKGWIFDAFFFFVDNL